MERLTAFAVGSVLLAAVIWAWPGSAPHQHTAASDFNNRVWAERLPRNSRDLVLYMVPVSVRGRGMGVVRRGSRYRSTTEVFRHQVRGNKVTFEFPQEQQSQTFDIRTWNCKDQAPAPFDMCLELKAGRETIKLYSRSRWRVDADDETVEPFGFELPELSSQTLPLCHDCKPGLPALFRAPTPPRRQMTPPPGADHGWALEAIADD